MSANWATLSLSYLSEKHIMMVLLPEQSESRQKVALGSNCNVCTLNTFWLLLPLVMWFHYALKVVSEWFYVLKYGTVCRNTPLVLC